MKRDLASGFALPPAPKRTPVGPEKSARFTSAEARKPPVSSKLRRAELGERMVTYLPPELATELRVRCARERRSLSDAVTVAVAEWLQASVSVGT